MLWKISQALLDLVGLEYVTIIIVFLYIFNSMSTSHFQLIITKDMYDFSNSLTITKKIKDSCAPINQLSKESNSAANA